MKAKILILLFLLSSVAVFSQKLIDEKKVPEAVLRTFKKKVSGATETKWFQKEQDFTAKYKIGEYPGESQFTRAGTLVMQKTGMDPKKLPQSIQSDLAKEHRGKKIYEVYLVVKGKKDKYYSIILHEKQGRKQAPLVYEAQYTMQGKFITLYEPEITPTSTEPTEEQPSKFAKDVDEDMDELREKAKDEKINRKDLPTKAETYLTENFDHEYRAKEILIRSNSKYGQYYQVTMKKQGERKQYILLFDYNGELLKKKVEEL